MTRRPDEINRNVVTHLFHGITRLQKGTQTARVGIEMKSVDGRLKPSAAENLLRYALHTILETGAIVGHHVLVWNFLLLDQDQRLRLIRPRQEPADSPNYRPYEKRGQQDPPAPANRNVPVVLPTSKHLV